QARKENDKCSPSLTGEPRKYDPNFKGPIEKRGCTDIVCCILFIICVLAYIAVGILAWSQGDPRKAIYPTDSRGQFCGQAGTPLQNKSMVFYFNILKCASPLVLLEFQCPTTQMCVEKCPEKYMTLLSAYPIKKDFDYYKNFCQEGVTNSMVRSDLGTRFSLFLMVLFLNFLTCFGFAIFCRECQRSSRETNIALSGFCVYRAIGHVMCSLFYPLFTFLLLALVIAYWAVTAVYPLNFSDSPEKKACPDSQCLFAFYGGETPYHKYLIVLQFYNVFLFFWCANFVIALGQMTLAGAFASYYWAFSKPDDIPTFPVFSSLGRSLRYHTGTLAFGALILSVVQLIRVLLEYLDHKLKGAQNKFAKFLLCCLKCCFWCLEKIIKFLNRNAYIMVAIYGKNFCTAAKDAFFLLLRNMIRVAVLDKVTDFLLFLGKLLVVGLVGVFAFFFFSGRVKAFADTAPNLHYYWVPILTVAVGSFLIASGFFSVYSMCVDTLFLCFCEDLERNDGSPARPYYMSSSLGEVLWKDKAGDASSSVQHQSIGTGPEEDRA
uniref:Choline transporter-like protein n=1 Tax=Oryzias sinensis TaxID=183150 RepID=A0A8C7YSB2_9TELE